MKKYLLVLALFAVGGIQAKRLKCVCNDNTAIEPDCGICGSTAGTMERTKDGVACICQNRLKLKDVSCPEVCRLSGGWSGRLK